MINYNFAESTYIGRARLDFAEFSFLVEDAFICDTRFQFAKSTYIY